MTVGSLDDEVSVADDGSGITPEDRERVFDAGYTTSPDGTGLGLAVVERAVDARGWAVESARRIPPERF